MITNVQKSQAIAPPSLPSPSVLASVSPRARRHATHVAGEVKGSLLTYADLHAFAWWYGGGWVTLNRGRKGLRRIHRGTEDVSRVRR